MQFQIKLLSPDTCTRAAWPQGKQGLEADDTGLMAKEDGLGFALPVLKRELDVRQDLVKHFPVLSAVVESSFSEDSSRS